MVNLIKSWVRYLQFNSLMARCVLVAFLASCAGFIFYKEAISFVVLEVVSRSDSSHGVFVPVLTGYFLWNKRSELAGTVLSYSWQGLPVIVGSILTAQYFFESYQAQFLCYIILICGVTFLIFGWHLFKEILFPIIFLVTMIPLSTELYNNLANISRTIAFGGSLEIITWFGIPHFRTGWDIELPNAILRVAISCSGIRYLISYFVFGIAYAYLYKTSTVGRVSTVLLTIPISLCASIIRLTIIFMMTYWVSPYWAEPRPHIVLSWLVFFSFLLFATSVDQWFQRRRCAVEIKHRGQ